MNNIWVMILVFVQGNSPYPVQTQFSSQLRCEEAKAIVQKEMEWSYGSNSFVVCVQQ